MRILCKNDMRVLCAMVFHPTFLRLVLAFSGAHSHVQKKNYIILPKKTTEYSVYIYFDWDEGTESGWIVRYVYGRGACLFMTFIVRDRSSIIWGKCENAYISSLMFFRCCAVVAVWLMQTRCAGCMQKDDTHLKEVRLRECSLQNGWIIFHIWRKIGWFKFTKVVSGGGWLI